MAPSAYKDSAAICACRSPVLVSISLWSSWWLANVMKAALYYMSVVPSVTLCWSFCLNECQHFQMGIEWRLLCSRRQATMLLNIMLHFTDHMLVCQVPYTMLRTEVFFYSSDISTSGSKTKDSFWTELYYSITDAIVSCLFTFTSCHVTYSDLYYTRFHKMICSKCPIVR